MTQPSSPDFNLPSLLGQTLACTCDVEHMIPTQAIVLQSKALDQVASVCTTHLPGQQVLLVADETTYAVAGQQVQQHLQQAGYQVDHHILPSSSDHAEPHAVMADDRAITAAWAAIQPNTDFLIAVGAGTVNDVTKLASFQAGLPYVTCPTAASVNGFTSAIAAILSHFQ